MLDQKMVQSYIVGFVLSIVLTVVAYVAVTARVFDMGVVIAILVGLAVVQLCVQLFFFLHLGMGKAARWRWLTLGFGLLVVVIVAGGSLWIMYHLNYNMMGSPEAMHNYMHRQSGF